MPQLAPTPPRLRLVGRAICEQRLISTARIDRAAEDALLTIENKTEIGCRQSGFAKKAHTPGVRASEQESAAGRKGDQGRYPTGA